MGVDVCVLCHAYRAAPRNRVRSLWRALFSLHVYLSSLCRYLAVKPSLPRVCRTELVRGFSSRYHDYTVMYCNSNTICSCARACEIGTRKLPPFFSSSCCCA
ncbi:unnamed protein product, partial [Sphacelaria rigidula]